MLKPLQQALHQSVAEIHHSDQGVQYLSSAYISTLTRHGIEISVARRGCPWENGYAGRLIRTLKEEEVHLNDYKGVMEARDRIGHFITQVYRQTPAFSVRVFNTCRISTAKLGLTFLIFGLNKRWHFIRIATASAAIPARLRRLSLFIAMARLGDSNMKNRYFTSTLILLILLTCGILIKASSQTQPALPKFRVAVLIDGIDNQVHQSQLEGAIKRELRSFKDVQIVGNDLKYGLWEYIIHINLFRLQDTYATSTIFYEKIPIEDITSYRQEYYRKFPAIGIPLIYTGYVGIDRLEDFGKITVTEFDKKHLQPIRDIGILNTR